MSHPPRYAFLSITERTGANVQARLKAIHHLDVPWRPADMVQREGRLLRRGNTNRTVRIFRYITEGSFDAYSWQILETKQQFISQFLSGSAYQRTASDLEENVLTYAQVKALAISDLRMKELAEKQNEANRLHMLSTAFGEERERLKQKLAEAREQAAALDQRRAVARENQRFLLGISDAEFRSAQARLAGILTEKAILGAEAFPEGLTACGFAIRPPGELGGDKPCVVLERQEAEYRVSTGRSPQGNARRVVNFLKGFSAYIRHLDEEREELLRTAEECRRMLETQDPYAPALRRIRGEIAQMREKIAGIRAVSDAT